MVGMTLQRTSNQITDRCKLSANKLIANQLKANIKVSLGLVGSLSVCIVQLLTLSILLLLKVKSAEGKIQSKGQGLQIVSLRTPPQLVGLVFSTRPKH